MSYTIHLKGVSASLQYAASYSYICLYFTCSLWHACRQTSPVRVTTRAALTSCLLPESLQLNTALPETWKKGHWEHLNSGKPIMNTRKLPAFAESIVTSPRPQGKPWALCYPLNNLHFPARFTIPLLAIAGDSQRAGYDWRVKLEGDTSCRTCVNMS